MPANQPRIRIKPRKPLKITINARAEKLRKQFPGLSAKDAEKKRQRKKQLKTKRKKPSNS